MPRNERHQIISQEKLTASQSICDSFKGYQLYFLFRDVRISRGRRGGVLMIMHAIVIRPLTSHPSKAGTEHAGFSPDQARTQSPSAKRRGVFGESHEG